MAQIPLRVNLSAQSFPYLSELQGQTVVVPQLDEVAAPHSPLTSDYSDTVAQPAIYYCHNVMPTSQGFQSVCFDTITPRPDDSDLTFTDVFVLRDSAGNKVYLGVTASGRNYILKSQIGGWVRTTDVAPATPGGLVTVAYVNGITYIFYAGTGCYIYDFAGNALNYQALTALTDANIQGILPANGYLLAFDFTNSVVWCSTLSVTDFTPSIITGAGGGAVQDVRGTIVNVIPHKLGFMIYSTYNIVIGVYTGNVNYPFTMKEVVGSGGVPGNRLVDKDPVTGDHYAYTSGGMQLVTSQNTNIAMPDLTDFLAGMVFEDFDPATGIFTTSFLTSPMIKRITQIADRYVVVSYGTLKLTHAIVFDTALKRVGKIRLNHADCFEYVLLGTNQVDTPRNCLGFMQEDGTVIVAAFESRDADNDGNGCLILGKFQLARANTCTLLEVVVENVPSAATFTCSDRYSFDGKNTAGTSGGYLHLSSGLLRQYRFRQAGMNHSLLFTGSFHLVSVKAKFGQDGDR